MKTPQRNEDGDGYGDRADRHELNHPPYPEDYLRFVELFNKEQYWESHEVLEGAWRDNLSTFYKGMIIYASAFVHAQRGNPRGVYKQLVKAEGYLSEYKPHYMGIDLDHLLKHLRRCKELVAVAEPPEGEQLSECIPYDHLELASRRVRGSEPEMSGSRTRNPPPS